MLQKHTDFLLYILLTLCLGGIITTKNAMLSTWACSILFLLAAYYLINNYTSIIVPKQIKILSITWLLFLLIIPSIDFFIHGNDFNTQFKIYKWIILYLAVLIFLTNIKFNINYIFYAVITATLITAVTGLLHLKLGYQFPFHHLINKIPAAYVMSSLTITTLIITLYYLNQQQRLLFLISSGIFIIGIISCLLTETRGVFISLPLIILILFFSQLRLSLSRKLVLILAIIIGAAIFSSVFTNLPARFYNLVSLLTSFNNDLICHPYDSAESSAALRIMFWNVGVEAIRENWLWGFGSSGFMDYLTQYSINNHCPDMIKENWSHLHNDFLNFLFSYGIFGFLALLSILTVPLVSFIRYTNHKKMPLKFAAIIGISLIIHTIFCQLTDVPLHYKQPFVLYLTLITVCYAVLYNKHLTK